MDKPTTMLVKMTGDASSGRTDFELSGLKHVRTGSMASRVSEYLHIVKAGFKADYGYQVEGWRLSPVNPWVGDVTTYHIHRFRARFERLVNETGKGGFRKWLIKRAEISAPDDFTEEDVYGHSFGSLQDFFGTEVFDTKEEAQKRAAELLQRELREVIDRVHENARSLGVNLTVGCDTQAPIGRHPFTPLWDRAQWCLECGVHRSQHHEEES